MYREMATIVGVDRSDLLARCTRTPDGRRVRNKRNDVATEEENTLARVHALRKKIRRTGSDLKLLSNFARATSVVKSIPRRPSLATASAVVYYRAARASCTHGMFKDALETEVVARAETASRSLEK